MKRFLGAALLSGFVASAVAAPPPLILGIFPRYNATDTMRMFTPLAEHLSRTLGREVRIETSKDFAAFWRGVTARRYDIVHYNQAHYIQSHAEFGYDAILMNEEDGASTIRGMIVVRKDSGIRRLEDLRGKSIVFGGDRTAMVSYILPSRLLREAGLRPPAYREEFAKNPPNAFLTVYARQADAAGVGDMALKLPAVTARADVSQVTVLARTAPMAQLPWAVKRDLPPALRRQIQEALGRLKESEEGRKILGQAQLTGLVAVTDAEYDPLRQVLRDAADAR